MRLYAKLKRVTIVLFYLPFFNSLDFHLFAQKQEPATELQIASQAIATIKLDGYPDFLAADGDDVWVTNDGRVEKLSVKSHTPILSVAIPEPCGAPVMGDGSLWVASCKNNSIYRIDPTTGSIIVVIPIHIADPRGEISMAFGAGSLWLLSDSSGLLSRIDAKTNAIKAHIKVKSQSYCATFGYEAVWITNTHEAGSVQRINPETNMLVTTIRVGSLPRFVAAGEGGIWTLNQKLGTISRIDPATNQLIATIKGMVPGTGGDIAAGANRVWVRSKDGTFLLTIDPITNRILNRYLPLCGSGAVRVSNNYVWVSAHDINTIWVLKK